MKLNKIILSFVSALAIILSSSVTSFAKVVGDKIVLGSAISLTGKYSSNGVHTQNGYNMAVDRINSMGGIKVGGKTNIEINPDVDIGNFSGGMKTNAGNLH